MTMFQMYVFTRLELINVISSAFSVLFGMATAVTTLMFFVTWPESNRLSEEEHEVITKALKIFGPLFMINLFVYAAVPTQKEAAAIVVVPKILSTENIDKFQKIGADGVDIVKLATEYTKGILESKVKKPEPTEK